MANALRKLATLLLFVIACELAGVFGSIFTIQSVPSWYSALVKPPFTPPDWMFAPIWTFLYALMGIAAFLVWEKKGGARAARAGAALNMFAVQLALNALWPPMFFGLRSPLLGFLTIILLLAALVLTMLRFFPLDRRAFWLMAPYFLWACFAALLNFYVLALNP